MKIKNSIFGKFKPKRENEETVYEFMLRAAKELQDEPQILTMLFEWGNCGIKIIADETDNNIYSLYGCDKKEKIRSKQPLCVGDVEHVVSYLNDKNNVDDVMKQM